MNQDNINNIQNAIDYLRSAKTDKNKELITYAIDYINKVINGIENEKQDIYVVELDRFNISNDNTNATETTIGINEALVYAKAAGYKRVKLPEGHYAIDTSVKNDIVLSDGIKTWTHHRQGITMQSDMELILGRSILEMIPCEDPYYSILTISNCNNSKITGGTILGDRETHDYGMRINENGNMFESGDFDSTTGEPIDDDTKVRTKDFISVYKDWFTEDEEPLPNKFYITPLWNTSKNTVDGGCRYIYCYDKDNNYLGLTTGGNGYIKQAILPDNTAKIKISLKDEKRLDAVLSMTKRNLYYTYEFGCGIKITDSHYIEINGTIVKDCIGDCIGTDAPPLNVTVDNLSIINCTLENSRRQGISFVATGENYLIKNCNIGKINGVDPQCGIDFEHYDYMKNTTINGCNFYDNKKWDIINYNGTEIEITNSDFSGGIATVKGHTMDIHNNKFEYRDTEKNDKVYKNVSLQLNTNNNLVHDNEFINGNTSNSGSNSNTYNNIFKNTDVTITSNGENKYYNSNVGLRQNNNFTILENNYFENCNVFNHNDSPSIEISNCIFEDSTYKSRGETLISNCTFNMSSKPIIDGWMTACTKVTYKNCSITSTYKSKIPLLGYDTCIVATFESCNFNISRYWLGYIHKNYVFNSCSFIFNDINESTDICHLNTFNGTATWTPQYWYFNNCYFKSNLPIKIYGGNIIDCTFDGDIMVS